MERKLVLRGLASGGFAGLLSFVFARIFAEPVIARAINYEGARDAAQAALDKAAGLPVPAAAPELFSRTVQEDVGIAVAMLVYGAALGALLAVVFTLVQRGSGRQLRPRVLALLLAAAGFVGAYLVPFLKYPANPPAIGHEDTIEARGSSYLVMVVVSLVALTLAVQLGRTLARSRGWWQASLLAGLGYVVVVGVTMVLLPGVDETPGPLRDSAGRIVLGGFDPDDLYHFRLYAVGGQLILWGALGLLLGPWAERVLARAGRPAVSRELASAPG
ncbi:MAG: CbtA family protein [Mycobacteriales bacterium]